ncbi:unnamed protein product [[Candida] boidinii]|nr:unnamed protein product [[Candida] boidinii]
MKHLKAFVIVVDRLIVVVLDPVEEVIDHLVDEVVVEEVIDHLIDEVAIDLDLIDLLNVIIVVVLDLILGLIVEVLDPVVLELVEPVVDLIDLVVVVNY